MVIFVGLLILLSISLFILLCVSIYMFTEYRKLTYEILGAIDEEKIFRKVKEMRKKES